MPCSRRMGGGSNYCSLGLLTVLPSLVTRSARLHQWRLGQSAVVCVTGSKMWAGSPLHVPLTLARSRPPAPLQKRAVLHVSPLCGLQRPASVLERGEDCGGPGFQNVFCVWPQPVWKRVQPCSPLVSHLTAAQSQHVSSIRNPFLTQVSSVTPAAS